MLTPRELIDLAVAAVEGDEFELARRIGYEKLGSASRQFARWRAAEPSKGPSFKYTIALLETAGLLRQPEELEELEALRVQARAVRRAAEQRSRVKGL